MDYHLMHRIQLSNNWQCKQRVPSHSFAEDSHSTSGWLPAEVPGTVHQALLAAKQIPDPFYGLNEECVQWIGESDWLYRCSFEYAEEVSSQCVALCFDGLDTIATVWLNGQQILASDNMFVPHRVQVASHIHRGQNELLILFESALLHGKKLEERYGKKAVWNGDASRVYVRKAQYHYGWDWGPVLMTSGPWLPIYLETYKAHVATIHCPTEIAANLEHASIQTSIACELSGAISYANLRLHLALFAPDGKQLDEQVISLAGDTTNYTFELDTPQLWWPRNYGEQHLYRIVATLLDQNSLVLDRKEQRVGLRRLKLVQERIIDGKGKTFFFEINNTPIFCGGTNWIPADSFLPSIKPERYRAWLQLAADAHMSMIRIWGGGIYENDIFYDTCDELGILVWQDFLFGCGIYPALDWFQKSVQAEVEATLLRLRHHPSIALWCGNNEDYLIAQSLGIYDSSFEGDFTTTEFPARAIYEHLLPRICEQFDAERPYWPGSPYGGKYDANDEVQGDKHEWDIWQKSIPYQEYPKVMSRFTSEFGIESFPTIETIESFTPPTERFPQSRVIDAHNKSAGGQRLLAGYIFDNIRISGDLSNYIYESQFIQAEAMGVAIRGWRRHWGHPDIQTGGALIWQLNDCWPVISWAIVDYLLRPKASYYVVRRELAPFSLGLALSNDKTIELWAVNGLTIPIDASIEISTWTLDGQLLERDRHTVTLHENQGTELKHLQYQAGRVISARLFKDEVPVARASLWPEPFKYYTMADPEISVDRLDNHTLRVQSKRPAKGVWLSAGADARWSDNMLDLFPGDPQMLKVQHTHGTDIQVRWLK